MNPQKLLAQAMRAYPLLYPEPLDVALAAIGNGSGYEWKGGELEVAFADPRLPYRGEEMNYTDLDEQFSHLSGAEEFKDVELSLALARARRQLTDQNLETMAKGDWMRTYFRESFHLSPHQRRQVRAEEAFPSHAPFLAFPDTVSAEWGQVISRFHDWLELRMRHELGPQESYWPAPAQALHAKIEHARGRLFPLLNAGKSLSQHRAETKALSAQLISELLAEEEGSPSGKKPPRP